MAECGWCGPLGSTGAVPSRAKPPFASTRPNLLENSAEDRRRDSRRLTSACSAYDCRQKMGMVSDQNHAKHACMACGVKQGGCSGPVIGPTPNRCDSADNYRLLRPSAPQGASLRHLARLP